MKRFTTLLLAAALLTVPAVALARHGHGRDDRGLHRSHGKVGVIKAFDESSDELTITTRKGRDITALVTDRTRVRCSDDSRARIARHGGDDDDHSGPGHGGHGGDDDDHGDDDATATPTPSASPSATATASPTATATPDDDETCDFEPGTIARRARIDLDEDDAVWTKLVLGS